MEIKQTRRFADWLGKLRDPVGGRLVRLRIERLASGLLGDAKAVGGKVYEMRIASGPGYRIYFTGWGAPVIILLCGGDKGSQRRDIAEAQQLAADLAQSSQGE